MKQESQSLDNNPTKERKLAKSKEGIKTQENEARFIGKFLKSQENINLEISKLETTIRNIFAIFSTEIDEKNLLCSLPDIKKHLEDLKLNSNKDINLFIEQASLILCSLKKLKESTEIILKGDPQTQINKEKIEKIEEEIESLHNYNFFSKIIKSADSKIKKLEFDKQQLIETNEKAKSKYKDNFNNNFGIDSIRHQIEDTISDVAKKEIIEKLGKEIPIAVGKSWDLIKNINSNELSSSIGESYIKNVVLPSNPDNRDENIEKKLLNAYKLYAERGYEENPKLKETIVHFANELHIRRPDRLFNIRNSVLGLLFSINVSEKLSNLKNVFKNLQKSIDETIVAKDFVKLSKIDLDYNFEGKLVSPSFDYDEILLSKNIEEQPLLKHLHLNDIEDWQAIKKTRPVNLIFGENVKRVDDILYKNIIEESFTNPEQSDLVSSLLYYKTPESVRDTFLLGISSKYYSTRAANYLFIDLAKDKNWSEVLDNTEKKYPYFKPLREILVSWKSSDFDGTSDFSMNPKINYELLNKFVTSIIEDENNKSEPDKKVITSALNALKTDQLVPFLEKNNLISKDEKMKVENLSMVWSKNYELARILKDCFYTILCQKYEGQDTIVEKEKINFYLKILDFYEGYFSKDPYKRPVNITISTLISLVDKKRLTKDRMFELASPIKTKNGEVDFMNLRNAHLLLAEPEFYLNTNDGLDLFAHIQKYGIDQMDHKFDCDIGNKLICTNMSTKDDLIDTTITYAHLEYIDPDFINNNFEVTKDNWKTLLINFIRFNQGQLVMVDEVLFKKLNDAFASDSSKDLCLNEMKKSWVEYLEGGDKNKFPFTSNIIAGCIKNNNGAGPLSQIAAVGFFQDNYSRILSRGETTEKTKNQIFDGMRMIEEKFIKEKWSNEDITNFYNISSEIISVAPSLFSVYFEVFEKLKAKDIKNFFHDVFPLHRVIIALAEKKDIDGKSMFNKRDLAKIRKDFVKSIIDKFGFLKPISEQKNELNNFILENFKNKFGIIKVKENFTPEHFRSLNDISMYLSNIQKFSKKEYYENVLSVYLALMINDKWDDFKKGEEINFQELLTEDKAYFAKHLAAKRTEINPVIQENLGVSFKDLPEFYNVLNSDVENMVMGNVETIDAKLNNVILNLDDLKDLDLYPPDSLDKKRMKLLLDYGNQKVGAVVAKIYQSLEKTRESFKFFDDEQNIKSEIESIFKNSNLEINSKNIKKYFQDEMRPFSVVMNMLSFVEEMGVKSDISELREMLKPSSEIISIFNKLGEEFKQTSGAIALSQDLEYLESLVSKNENKITNEENLSVKKYLNQINQKITRLEDDYKKINEKFKNIKQGQGVVKNQILTDKINDIDKIINKPGDQEFITSGMTTNFNYIMENIRNCLSCVTQGVCNDTNLTFGDQNKFYLYSKTGKGPKSISDEILFLEPVKYGDTSEMSFVFDQVYGTKTPTILLNQIEVVIKKYKEIKKKFPDAKLSLFVTDSALLSSGLSAESLESDLPNMKCEVNTVTVNVLRSPAADHYIEIGGGNARSSGGERIVSGVLIK